MARIRGAYMTKIDYELGDQDRTRTWLTANVSDDIAFSASKLRGILDDDEQATIDEQIAISRALGRRRNALFLADGCARMRDR